MANAVYGGSEFISVARRTSSQVSGTRLSELMGVQASTTSKINSVQPFEEFNYFSCLENIPGDELGTGQPIVIPTGGSSVIVGGQVIESVTVDSVPVARTATSKAPVEHGVEVSRESLLDVIEDLEIPVKTGDILRSVGARVQNNVPQVRNKTAHWRLDGEDRMFQPELFEELNKLYGPFEVDQCCDEFGENSHCRSYHCPSRSSLDPTVEFRGLNSWFNVPYSRPKPFIEKFLSEHRLSPHNTSAVFLLPMWKDQDWWNLIEKNFNIVKIYPKGSLLFSGAPAGGEGERYPLGPTRWPVVACHMPCVIPPIINSGFGVSKIVEAVEVAPENISDARSHDPSTQNVELGGSYYEAPLLGNICCEGRGKAFVLIGKFGGRLCRFLLDSGAERDFIDERLVSCLGEEIVKQECKPINIKMANGAIATSAEQVEGLIRVGSYHQMRKATVTALAGYDFILGQPWFREFEPDFNWTKQTCAFEYRGKVHRLQAGKQEGAGDLLAVLTQTQMDDIISESQRTGGEDFFLMYIKELHGVGMPDPNSGEIPVEHYPTTPEENKALEELIAGYGKLFSEPPDGLPVPKEMEHEINLLPDSKIPFIRGGRMSVLELEELKSQIDTYLAKGYVRFSSSPYSAGLLFARKKNGKLRLCMDYRALNKITVRDRTSLPRIDDCLDQFKGAKVFSKLDLTSGYNQIRVKESDIPKTAFNTRYGHFEFTVMPFGLCNAPATFMNWMNSVLREFIDKFVVVYIDDISVYSQNVEEHLVHLNKVFAKLESVGAYAQRDKCDFLLSKMDFLGHIVSANGVHMDDRKVAAIKEWPVPTNKTELASFCGLVGFYRKFCNNLSKVSVPLTELTRKDVVWKWGVQEDQAFIKMKDLIAAGTVLVTPDPTLKYFIHCDASGFATGAVLEQDHGKGLQPCAFISKKMLAAERNYPVHEQELLAVIRALKEWRCYLHGCSQTISIYTDHHSLTYLQTQPHLSTRQVRWVEFMSDYDLETLYIPGPNNVVADALSRRADLVSLSAVNVLSWFLTKR